MWEAWYCCQSCRAAAFSAIHCCPSLWYKGLWQGELLSISRVNVTRQTLLHYVACCHIHPSSCPLQAFAQFDTLQSAQKAKLAIHGRLFDGQTVNIVYISGATFNAATYGL